jgi:circadian clock protein KaiC
MASSSERLSTGVAGLDEVLRGGLIPSRTYLVRGAPGTGKTILGLHFLSAGENTLFISLSETEKMVRAAADSLNIDLKGVTFLDLTPNAGFFAESETYDIFSPAEVERGPTTEAIVKRIRDLQPRRVFIDAINQLRYLTTDDQEFRRHIFSLLRFLREQGTTVLFTSESGEQFKDEDLQFVSDGVIQLEREEHRRAISVLKLRGTGFQEGSHALKINDHGLHIYPRLIPDIHTREFMPEIISSGIDDLDALLHGGLERGTVTLITGPIGVGKTTVGLHFLEEAARRGERSVIYLFEESIDTVVHRCESIGIPVERMVEGEHLSLVPVEPLQMAAEEFASRVREEVEIHKVRIVMLDSVAGYRLAVHGEELVIHLHALTRYLRNMGVTVVLINETDAIAGPLRATDYGFSYLADNVIFMRYLEIRGRLHKALGVLKKRASDFEKSLRELKITSQGLRLGPPLQGVGGVLSGALTLEENVETLTGESTEEGL